MKESVTERVLKEGEYIAKTGATVRDAAKEFGVGKSTVHSDMVKKLKFIDKDLYKKVKSVLYVNLSQRHIRGGMATREKFKNAYKKG